jgi:hypothetical protein
LRLESSPDYSEGLFGNRSGVVRGEGLGLVEFLLVCAELDGTAGTGMSFFAEQSAAELVVAGHPLIFLVECLLDPLVVDGFNEVSFDLGVRADHHDLLAGPLK